MDPLKSFHQGFCSSDAWEHKHGNHRAKFSGAPFAKAGTHRTKVHSEVGQLILCDDSLVPVIITSSSALQTEQR